MTAAELVEAMGLAAAVRGEVAMEGDLLAGIGVVADDAWLPFLAEDGPAVMDFQPLRQALSAACFSADRKKASSISG